jgi:hypothetical protein
MPNGPVSGAALGSELATDEAEGFGDGECTALGGDPPPHESVRRAAARRTAPGRISRTNVTATPQSYEAASTFLTPFGPGHFG